MTQKQEISIEAKVLLKLIRIALGTEPLTEDGKPAEPFPQAIDWAEVMRLSYVQKVSALAVDGLKASGCDPKSPVLASWFNDVKNNEDSYDYYLAILTTLCQIFKANGLKTIILKGYGVGLNYPIPSHRGAGDIDFYLLDENDRPAGMRGDELLQGQYAALFHKMDHQNSYHTQYSFKGIVLENHYSIIGEFFNRGKEQLLENHLEELIAEGYTPAPDIDGAYLPSTMFTALHLMRHSFAHCYFGEFKLRNLLDYYSFLRRYGNQLDGSGKEVLEKSGLAVFADCIDDVVRVIFEGKAAQNPASQMIIGDIFVRRPEAGGIRNFFHWYRDRRKIRFLTGESWAPLTLRSVMGHLLGREE